MKNSKLSAIANSLSTMALTITGCASMAPAAGSDLAQNKARTDVSVGRVIEFKSDMNGFDTRTFFYEGAEEVIAFDTQFTPELARQSIVHLRQFTNKPISWVVITHPNPDKFNGASVFKQEGARIIASENTARAIPGVHAYKEYFFVKIAKMFKRDQYPQPVPVDQTFVGSLELVLKGGERIFLRELAQPGVSSTQSVAYVPSINSLFVGDLVHNKAHAWLEGGIVNGKTNVTLAGWIADLKELQMTYPTNPIVYGGRGVSARLQESVQNQIRYLETAVKLVRQELRILGTKAKAFNGAEAGAMYKALAQKFQTKFPDYEHSYMIEYGAYGLVQNEIGNKNQK